MGIWLGPDDSRPDNSWLTIGECDGGLESAAGTDFHVTSEMIREVVSDTQLFRPQGSERAVWFHRSYAEYLTARYLDNMHGVQIEQLESLLCHPSLRGHIVPQLRGVATWMGTRPDVLKLICQCDPQAVLFVDIDVHSDSDRNIAVDAILQAVRDTQLSDFGLPTSRYRRLRHPGLPEQIRPIIADRSRSRLERRVAIDLAEQCCLSDLQSPLLSVVMDRDDDYHLRVSVLAALSESPDVTTRAALRGFLPNGLDDDVDDDLRGYALRALWPNDLSIDEILPLLTPLKRPNYDGGYCHFVYHDFPAGLRPERLALALAWLNGLPDDQLSDPPFSNLLDDTLTRSLEQPLSEELKASIGRAFWRKLRAHERWSNQETEACFAALLDDAAKRRALLASLFSRLPTDEQHLWRVVVSFEPKIVRAADISWLLERLDREPERPVRQLVADLAAYFLSHSSRSDFERILAAAETHPELHESLSPVIDPIPLNSDRANQLRQAYASQMSRPDARRQAPLLDPPPRERILRLLDRSEMGESDAWIEITYDITLTPTSRHYGHLREADLRSQPGWLDADADFRERLISAAERYLAQSSPDAEAWIDDPQGSWTDPPIAGVKALWLLRDAAPERFSSLSTATWERWTPAILHYRASGAEKEHLQRRLTAHAYNQSPAVFLNWLRRLLRRDNAARLVVSEPQQDGPPVDREEFMPTDIGRRISECWDEQLAAVIRNFAMSDATNPTVYANLIDALLSHRDFATIQTIEEQLATAASGQVTDRQRLCVAASSLLKYAPALAIQAIARRADVDAPLCRDIFSRWANEAPFAAHAEAVALLREDQAADLYLLMRRTLPNPARQEADNDAATHVLSQIPGYIAAQGTFTAIAAIDRLLAAYSADQALRFIRLDAERFALEATWIPCQPADVLTLVRDQHKRLIRSGEELVEVLKESVRRFEQELQGETPQNFTLWDEQPHSRDDPIVFRPKNEESLSNVLRKHFERDLRDRGIITNREVEIRPRQGSGGSPGEYTDIQIDAVSLRPADASIARIRAIAELKGCWNPGIDSAMQLQLRDRYLKDNDCYHGLYVVGWYLCPQWDADDYRLDAATRLMPATIDECGKSLKTRRSPCRAMGSRSPRALSIVACDDESSSLRDSPIAPIAGFPNYMFFPINQFH